MNEGQDLTKIKKKGKINKYKINIVNKKLSYCL